MAIVLGYRTWKATIDENSFVDYKITFLIQGSLFDGPTNALSAIGLPAYGDTWAFGDDENIWAWCRWDADATPEVENETNTRWYVTQRFSTKPPDVTDRPCSELQFSDPLSEPQKLSGSFVKYTREAPLDKNGNPITNSALEPLRGDKVTFDNNRPQVIVEQNVLDLQYDLLCAMVDTVNQFPLWGFAPRMVKLSNVSWERKFYGLCTVYFTRRLTFDIDTNTFDKVIMDEGTKVLHGHWDTTTGNWTLDNIAGNPPNPSNPRHFDQFKDRNGENARIVLNGQGQPAGLKVLKTYYLAISGGTAPLSDSSQWFPLNSNTPEIAKDNLEDSFEAGDMFVASGDPARAAKTNLYLATVYIGGGNLNIWDAAGVMYIGPAPPYPVDQGVWVEGTEYSQGALVQATARDPAGNILVQYYPEADATILGIPQDFNDFSPYLG